MNHEKEIFEPYLQKQYQKAGAVTYGEKLKVIETLISATRQGQVPISPDQRIKLNPDNPTVQAIREGRPVSLEGTVQTSVSQRVADKKEADTHAKKKGLLGLALLLIPLLMLGSLLLLPDKDETTELAVVDPTATIAVTATAPVTPFPPTAVPTRTPAPTLTPVPVDADEYTIRVSESDPLASHNNPIALAFAGREWRVTTAKLEAEWQPDGVEWWPDTDVRRVLAVPYEQTLIDNIFAQLEQPITIRLRSGVAIQYQIDDIQRVRTYAIEHLMTAQPSIALILYGQPGQERWLITGHPYQEVITTTATDSLTLETAPFVTVQTCEIEGLSLTCLITLPIKQRPLLETLQLTDQAWLEQPDYEPVTTTAIVAEDGTELTIQIMGIVRSPETAVLTAVENNETLIQSISR